MRSTAAESTTGRRRGRWCGRRPAWSGIVAILIGVPVLAVAARHAAAARAGAVAARGGGGVPAARQRLAADGHAAGHRRAGVGAAECVDPRRTGGGAAPPPGTAGRTARVAGEQAARVRPGRRGARRGRRRACPGSRADRRRCPSSTIRPPTRRLPARQSPVRLPRSASCRATWCRNGTRCGASRRPGWVTRCGGGRSTTSTTRWCNPTAVDSPTPRCCIPAGHCGSRPMPPPPT